MKKDPAFLFYSRDFYEGVALMNFEDRGKYITILCVMHQKGRLSEESIRFLVGSVSVSLEAKFSKDEGGLWYNERLEYELDVRRSFVDSRIENGKLGGRPKASAEPSGLPNGNPIAKPSAEPNGKPTNNLIANANDNRIKEGLETIKESFDKFWDLYEKKIGKPKTLNEWKKLSDEERLLALKYTPAYKLSKEKQYRKDPERFLRNKCWNDELISFQSVTKKEGNGYATNPQEYIHAQPLPKPEGWKPKIAG